MKAVGFNQPRAIEDVHALEDIQLEQPKPGPRDLLVAVEANAPWRRRAIKYSAMMPPVGWKR